MAYEETTPFTLLDILRAEFGEDCAKLAARHFGGSTVYVCNNPDPDGDLARIIGFEKAVWLGIKLGRVTFYVPKADSRDARLDKVARLSAEGLRVVDIARHVGLSERHVYVLRAELRQRRLLNGDGGL